MIYRCEDPEVISNIIHHPEVIDFLTDDGASSMQVQIHPSIIYLTNSAHTGLIQAVPMNVVMCQVHIATTPDLWGKGHDFVAEAIQWGFTNTLYQKIIGMIPAYNYRTINLIEDLGFIREGILKKSFLKNWILHDQLIYSLSKGE